MRGLKRFKNGNLHIKFCDEDMQILKKHRDMDIEMLFGVLCDNGCEIVGDEFCIDNYNMGCLIHDHYNENDFILNFRDLDNMIDNKKTIILKVA